MKTIGPRKDAFRKYCFKRLLIKKEFVKLFSEVLKLPEFKKRGVSHRHAFKLLNNVCLNVTGKQRFKDYESFVFTQIRLKNMMMKSKLSRFKPIKYWTTNTFLAYQSNGQLLN